MADEHALRANTQLENYIITRQLGGGGFSLVYLAQDAETGDEVAIKEYMPRKLAYRSSDGCTIHTIDETSAEQFSHGRRMFFQEANALAAIKHPNIINVMNFFRANDTVYMVMEFVEGINLQSYIKRHNGGLSEKLIYHVFLPLLDGLKLLHEKGLLHMDIKPGNIHLRPGGDPVLLDFGAVHQIQTSRKYQPGQVLTLGFSPIEQSMSGGYVGPWTDIYAIGATMRACLDGQAPPPAEERRMEETMRPAVEVFKKGYSEKLLRAIDWAMEVDPMYRPQNVDEMIKAMTDGSGPPRSNSNNGDGENNRENGESMLERLTNSFPWIKGGS